MIGIKKLKTSNIKDNIKDIAIKLENKENVYTHQIVDFIFKYCKKSEYISIKNCLVNRELYEYLKLNNISLGTYLNLYAIYQLENINYRDLLNVIVSNELDKNKYTEITFSVKKNIVEKIKSFRELASIPLIVKLSYLVNYKYLVSSN